MYGSGPITACIASSNGWRDRGERRCFCGVMEKILRCAVGEVQRVTFPREPRRVVAIAASHVGRAEQLFHREGAKGAKKARKKRTHTDLSGNSSSPNPRLFAIL